MNNKIMKANMDLNSIITLAKTFLPNSPLIDKMEQAKNFASNFSQSPDGVKTLMQQLGKTRTDLQNALAMLNNPMVSQMINRVSPNLTERLRTAGNQIINEQTNNTSVNPTQSYNTNKTVYNNGSYGVDNTLSALRNKLKNL